MKESVATTRRPPRNSTCKPGHTHSFRICTRSSCLSSILVRYAQTQVHTKCLSQSKHSCLAAIAGLGQQNSVDTSIITTHDIVLIQYVLDAGKGQGTCSGDTSSPAAIPTPILCSKSCSCASGPVSSCPGTGSCTACLGTATGSGAALSPPQQPGVTPQPLAESLLPPAA
jgi:hypothetical protein